MILVAGGTGVLGRRVVRRLLDGGEQVRVLTRDGRRAAPGTETVVGDVRRGGLGPAVEGCDTVVSAVHGFVGGRGTSPATVDRDGNARLVTAASRAGVRRFVLVSVVGAAPDHPMSLHRMKYAAEQDLLASGMGATVVRATSFAETWLEIVGSKLAAGGPALVLGPGENPVNFVSAEDVAAMVVLAAQGDARLGEVVPVGGPEDLTFTQVAELLLASRASAAGVRHVPLPVLRALSVLARPVRPAFARQAQAAVVMNTADLTWDDGGLRARFPELPRTTLAELTRDVQRRPAV